MNEAGKGSRQRPTNQEAYAAAWDRIFKKASSLSTQDAPNVAPVMPMPSTTTDHSALPATPTQESNENQ